MLSPPQLLYTKSFVLFFQGVSVYIGFLYVSYMVKSVYAKALSYRSQPFRAPEVVLSVACLHLKYVFKWEAPP